LAFGRRQLRAAADETVAHALGEAFLHPGLPRAYVLNTLYVDAAVEADALVAALDDIYGDAYLHRRAFVEDVDTGARLARALSPRGWLTERDLYMALRRPRDRPPEAGLAREVDAATHRLAEAATVREEPYGRDEDVVRQLVGMRSALADAVPTARFFVGRTDGVDAAVTTLYSDGVIAQVEDVATLRDYRRRGLARAAVSAAVDAAVEMGHRLIFIIADEDDWPKELYGRLGFDPIGRGWSLTRPGPEHPAYGAVRRQ
jgi:GNAT superfamily N-acetyltransferase